MSTMNQSLPPVNNRFAALTPEEAVYLALLDLDRPADGIESDPELWGPETDAHRWEPTEEPSDHSAADELEAAQLFADAEGWHDQDVFLDDPERPRQTWTPSRIAAHEFEYQERR